MTRAIVAMLGLALALGGIGLPLSVPSDAHAESDQELSDRKTAWQDNYRLLLHEAAMVEQDGKTARENYARARRRNYPRGGARQQYIINAEAAEQKLVTVKLEIEQLADNARRDAIPPHWLYQVEDEPISLSPPASVSSEEADSDDDDYDDDDWDDEDFDDEAEARDREDDRAGRNPLYFRE